MKTLRARLLASVALVGFAIANSPVALADLPELQAPQIIAPTAEEVADAFNGATRFGGGVATDGGVAIDGDTAMVVLDRYDAGQIDPEKGIAVFHRAVSGEWIRVGSIDRQPHERFYIPLTLKGGTALVSASAGILVYRQVAGAWTRTATISAPGVSLGRQTKYDADSRTLAVNTSAGLYLVGLNANGQVATTTQIVASDTEPVTFSSPQFDLVGDTFAVVGATSTQKAVYVFRRSGNQWTQTQKVTAPLYETNNNFGSAIALNRYGGLLVGDDQARAEDWWTTPDGHGASGVVHVFTSTSNGPFNYLTELRPRPDELFKYWGFGSRIVTDGERAVISAYEWVSQLDPYGTAVVYEPRGNQPVATYIARFNDYRSVALSGDRLILGSPYIKEQPASRAGWADIYTLPPIGQ